MTSSAANPSLSDVPDMAAPHPRIQRIRERYQKGHAHLSIERARYYTETWKATESIGACRQVRVAMAMQKVYRNMTHLVDLDDRIAGHWTEHYLGVPIDIERGIFNEVMNAELSKTSMLANRARSLSKSLWFMTKKGALGEFAHNQKILRKSGGAPLDFSLKTMQERQINPFQIGRSERHELVRQLIPYWKGKTLADKVDAELRSADVYSEAMGELSVGMPGNTSRQVMMLSSCATVATIQGHLILDYERVLALGLSGMRAEIAQARAKKERSSDESDTLRAMDLSLQGVSIFAERLAQAIEAKLKTALPPERASCMAEMLEVCRRVPFAPARTFREALQSMWTIKTAVELAHPINLHCFGRLDQSLYPYYAADLKAGRICEEEATELLEELLLKLMSQNLRPESNMLSNFYHRFFGSTPVTLGGIDKDGCDATNELTYLFLKAAHRSKAVTNVSVRIAPETPDRLLTEIAGYLREGTSSFSLFNDTMNIQAMEGRGFAPEDAADYAVMGCVETTCPGKTGSMSANALLLSRILDITIRNGDSRTMAGTLRGEGLTTGDPDDFSNFEEFLGAFLEQARFFIGAIVKGSNIRDQVFSEILPAPMISAFTDGCMESATDVTRGGATYDLTGISMINSIANVTDSLYVIKKLIFEERSFDFATLRRALDENFEGYASVERAILGLKGKWGNGNAESDALAQHVMRELCNETHNYRSYKDAPVVAFAISMTTHTIDGRLSMATPDGRKAATPYAASGNPYNVERAGITGALRSVAALPHDDLMGCAVNMRFHPSGIGNNDQARAKWVALVRTYFALGGSQLQPTVASIETLRKAQAQPDQYRDLIIKVGGYSTYFVDLGIEIQEEIIARTEHV